MDERERLVLQQRAIDALRERIRTESYMRVTGVAKRFGVSRSVVESWPFEILPYVNTSKGEVREHRRYHPADVLAADARLRAWERAKQRGEGEAYLAKLRAELEELDRQAVEMARQARAEVA